jgi:competence protein ComEC
MAIAFSPRMPFCGLAIYAAAGIICAECFGLSIWIVVAVLLICAVVVLVWKNGVSLALFVASVFSLLHYIAQSESPAPRLARELSSNWRPIHGIAVVDEEPQEAAIFRGEAHSYFRAAFSKIATPTGFILPAAPMLLKWTGPTPGYGDSIEVTGEARNIPPMRNPGGFDYPAYLRRTGVLSEARARYESEGRVLKSGAGNPIQTAALRSRHWLQSKLQLDLNDSPEVVGLIQSMVLGLKDETPTETRELFQRTGTLHLFVVNGLHVGMLAVIAWFLIKPTRVGRRAAILIIIPLLAFYAIVTGLSAGSVRATVMAAIVLGTQIAERRSISMNNLFAAAFLILLWNTNELFMSGFQFSFGVVAAIILLAGVVYRHLKNIGLPDPFLPRILWNRAQVLTANVWRRAAQLLSVSLSAWVGSLPFTARYFHLWSPSGLLANIFVVPAAFAVLGEGILALVSAIVSSAAAMVFNNANWFFAHYVLTMVGAFAHLPGGHLYVELPSSSRRPDIELEIFDLGAGGATFLRASGHDWLFDCGNLTDYENIVRPYLRTRGINRLDGFLLSHGSSAHIGGAQSLMADFAPRQIADSMLRDRSPSRLAFHAAINRTGVGKSIFESGDEVQLTPTTKLEVLYPPAGLAARTSADKALVVCMENGAHRILFTFQIGFVAERWLLDQAVDLRSEIWIKGLHPSDASGLSEFIDAINPAVIVCASTDFPETARIPDDWAKDIRARGIKLFRQDRTGAVHIALDDDNFELRGFLNQQFFSSRNR